MGISTARRGESEKIAGKDGKRGKGREKGQMGFSMARGGLVWPGGREGKGGERGTKDENGGKR